MGFVMRVIAEQLGFQYFALTQHVDVVAAGSGVIHIHNYPDRWADFYAANALGITDPVHRACHMTSWGFRWTQMPALIPLTSGDHRHLARGRQAGIGDGFTIPSNIGGQPPGSCTFANAGDRPLREDRLLLAQLLGNYAFDAARRLRSEEHTSELQSLMRNSYTVFCLKKQLYQNTNGHVDTQLNH